LREGNDKVHVMNAVFYISAAVALLCTVMVISRSNVVHALLYLIVSLFAVAVIFFVLGAPFAAALEVIIYAGAIMVLFVFVVMLLNLGGRPEKQERLWLDPKAWVGPSIMALVLVGELVYVLRLAGGEPFTAIQVTPKEVSVALFAPYLLGVELSSMLLLAGLVGAYHLARRDRPADPEQGGGA
jgi:NADH-quinone oxidoreductase subunit J